MRHGRTVGWSKALELFPYLLGAEGEGETPPAGGDPGKGGETPPITPSSSGDGGDTDGGDGSGDSGKQEVFDRAYVEELRKEAANYRKRATAAENKLQEEEKAKMDDLTRAQTDAAEAVARAEGLEARVAELLLSQAVTSAATSANFHDPQDALSLLNRSEIVVDEEGVPNAQSVAAAVARLATQKPHLVKATGPGSGDGGARGTPPATVEEKQAEYVSQFQQAGGVPKPR